MTKWKLAAFVIVVLLSAAGLVTLVTATRGLYADWAFLRSARLQNDARAAQHQQQ